MCHGREWRVHHLDARRGAGAEMIADIDGIEAGKGDAPIIPSMRDGGWATLVKRLKAAPPHFVAHVKAAAPKIIMRRSATSERTVTPAPGIIISRTIKSSFVRLWGSSSSPPRSPSYATSPAPLGERSRMRPSTLPGCYESA
jgi:hypothetical protein